MSAQLRRRLASAALIVGFFLLWEFLCWASGISEVVLPRPSRVLVTLVARMPALCGLGLYGSEGRDWAGYGGYTYLHRPLPIYWPADFSELASQAPNVMYPDRFVIDLDPPPGSFAAVRRGSLHRPLAQAAKAGGKCW